VSYFKKATWSVYIAIFYVGIGLIIFVIADVFYVSYSFAKKKFSFMWPLGTLRHIVSLFVTILFMPLLDYFVSILGCVHDEHSHKLVHSAFPEIECWSGIHILHGILSIIVSLLFVMISLVVSGTYFECRSSMVNDSEAR